MTAITQAVGIRNGTTMMPNTQADLNTITALLDRIPLANGGTAAAPRLWNPVRAVLIPQVTAAIVLFQTVNRRPMIDGVVDPNGQTLRLMDQLAGAGRVTATVVRQDISFQTWVVADPASLDGRAPIQTQRIAPRLTRKLISVTGCSIKWFGVVLPRDQAGRIIGGRPNLFFTPGPSQGHYHDGTYEAFTAWTGLWDKYTSAMGAQLVQSGAPQILVIPFYKNAQLTDLGGFLGNWKEVVSAVVTAAINATDPLFLRDTFTFTEIFSSSFSNGIAPHQNFNTRATDAAAMTRIAFDLDGQASGSHWRPNRAVVYANTPAGSVNPAGTVWKVGGRLGPFHASYPGVIDHNLCPFLLVHGLSRFGR